MTYKDTGLEFVLPSPNIPTEETIYIYLGSAIFEGTNISEGRGGTTKPFQFVGAPFINGRQFTQKLNSLNLPGVRFRQVSFTPSISKYQGGELCHGVEIHIINPKDFNGINTGLYMVKL